MLIDKNLVSRLEKFMKTRGLTNTDCARVLGFGAGSISRFIQPGYSANAKTIRTLEYRLDECEKNPNVSFEGQVMRKIQSSMARDDSTTNCILVQAEGVPVLEAIEFLTTLSKMAPHALIKLEITA